MEAKISFEENDNAWRKGMDILIAYRKANKKHVRLNYEPCGCPKCGSLDFEILDNPDGRSYYCNMCKTEFWK